MDVQIHHSTIKGKFHDANEDACFIGNGFLIIADGMGGESSGDIASHLAVSTIKQFLESNLPAYPGANLRELMLTAITMADESISAYVEKHPESYGMGTTVLLMVRNGNKTTVAWCGDSRCYAYGNGRLQSLTKDHSYVQDLIDSAKISIDESFSHPDSNIITRFVGGGNSTCRPDFVELDIADFDVIILTSDGLSGYCRDADIALVIAANREPASLPAELTELALRSGSLDDITIITLFPRLAKPRRKHSWFRLLTG